VSTDPFLLESVPILEIPEGLGVEEVR